MKKTVCILLALIILGTAAFSFVITASATNSAPPAGAETTSKSVFEVTPQFGAESGTGEQAQESAVNITLAVICGVALLLAIAIIVFIILRQKRKLTAANVDDSKEKTTDK